MQNLSDDERRDIDDLVNNLNPKGIEEKPAEEEISNNGSNGEGSMDVTEDHVISEAVTTDNSPVASSNNFFLSLILSQS